MKQNFTHSNFLNMNNKFNFINFFALFFLLLFSFAGFSQKIETVNYNGKQCLEYPFKINVRTNQTYYSSVNTRKHLNTIIELLKENQWKDLTKEQFDLAIVLFKKQIKQFQKLSNKGKNKQDIQLSKVIRVNPYPLLEQIYELDVDIKPCLDAIPDGTYIQYFYDFPLINENNELSIIHNKVAGIFEIKNNLLNGKATWFNFKGDTLKNGIFKNGLKEGEWYFERRELESRITKENKELYIKNGSPKMDTIIEKMMYSNGLRNGFYTQYGSANYPFYEGHYLNNEFTGDWIERLIYTSNFAVTEEEVNNELLELKNNELVTGKYTYSNNKVIVKQPIIRDGLILNSEDENYNFESKYTPFDVSKNLFDVAFNLEPDVELDEENTDYYEGEETTEDSEYEEEYEEESYYYGEDDVTNFQPFVYDQEADKYLIRGKAIDSLGLKFNFEGIYERYYTNGQLMFRYEFIDGKLLKEDTLFWDNGIPYDVINFQKDSNQFIRSIYDYDGKLFNEVVFDSKGDFVRVNFKPNYTKNILIDGIVAKDFPENLFFSYDKMDTLKNEIQSDSILLWKSWNRYDTTKLYESMYFPKDRILRYTNFSMSGLPSMKGELTFNEDFNSWTGIETFSFDNLTLASHKSASYFERFYDEQLDSLPQLKVNQSTEYYDITSDNILYKENEPFSGPIVIHINSDQPKFKTGTKLDLSFPNYLKLETKLEDDYRLFKKSGKSKLFAYINSLDYTEIGDDHSVKIITSLFPFLEQLITFPEIYPDYDDDSKEIEYNEKEESPFAKTIVGKFKNGKPEGTWIVKDQFDNFQAIIPFINGEIDGEYKTYNTEYPNELSEYDLEDNQFSKDTMPAKKTTFLSSVEHFKNGYQNGESIYYNWLGETILKQNYKDGLRQGPSFERNNFAISKMNYLDDALDGYMQTFLTLKGKDSILLYDLNFQNGLLQGESKSYHLNGKISKRGFFLNGQSIDDYEAYDSLGFKYHYVKFLYSFPVEEKVWEENELSARYLFDWKDSIYFSPSDITSSESLEDMLANLGITETATNYYGRPTLVEKNGIDYHLTKYYPNDTIARDGKISSGKKVGPWKYFSYEGELLYKVDYADSLITINDSIQFKSKGVLTDYNSKGNPISKSFIIEKFEKYDCSHSDHHEIRQLYTTWESNDSLKRINGYVKNHYDNGVIQNEGNMKNGLPTGIWKFYDPFGNLNQVGVYVMGKRDGRWLAGDLSKTKYLGDICLNPNLPNIENEIKMREKLLDIVITNYKLGKAFNKEYYDIDWNEVDKK